MTSILIDKPLKIYQRHEPMKLYRKIDKQQTNAYHLKVWFSRFLYKKYSVNTALAYKGYGDMLIDTMSFDNPQLSVKLVYNFLEGKRIPVHAAVKAFLKFILYEFNKSFAPFDFPDIYKSHESVIKTITEKEIEIIIKKLPNKYKFFCRFQYICGLRISEPFGITINNIDWKRWRDNKEKHALLTLTNTKGKRDRQIPINPKFVKEIQHYIENNSEVDDDGRDSNKLLFDYGWTRYSKKKFKSAKRKGIGSFMNYKNERDLFEYRRNWVRRLYVEKSKRAFYEEFKIAVKKVFGDDCAYYPHILRKSRATILLKSGVPILEVSKFLGHRDIKTTMKYLNSDINDRSRSMERLGL